MPVSEETQKLIDKLGEAEIAFNLLLIEARDAGLQMSLVAKTVKGLLQVSSFIEEKPPCL